MLEARHLLQQLLEGDWSHGFLLQSAADSQDDLKEDRLAGLSISRTLDEVDQALASREVRIAGRRFC